MNANEEDRIITSLLIVIDDNYENHMESGELGNLSKDILDKQEELALTPIEVSRLKEKMREGIGEDIERILYIYYRYHYSDTILTNLYSSDTIFKYLDDLDAIGYNECRNICIGLLKSLMDTIIDYQIYHCDSLYERDDFERIIKFVNGVLENEYIYEEDEGDIKLEDDPYLDEDIAHGIDHDWLIGLVDIDDQCSTEIYDMIKDRHKLRDLIIEDTKRNRMLMEEWMLENITSGIGIDYSEFRLTTTVILLSYIKLALSKSRDIEFLKLITSKFNRYLQGVDIT